MAFSKNGGIERFNKCFLHALSHLDKEGVIDSKSYSAYDTEANEAYYPKHKYKGFSESKPKFVAGSLLAARRFDIIIIGHVNMAIAGYLIKKIYPSKQVILITHGIDVWYAFSGIKQKFLKVVDRILSVSQFTKDKLIELNNVPAEKIKVFPNTIDPYFKIPASLSKDNTMRGRYGIHDNTFVLYTLTRLSNTELFKGYDKVLVALKDVIKTNPNVHYVIAGKYDEAEKSRIDNIIEENNLQGHVTLTGFLKEEELTAHYQMADTYIMPSKKEGFGIVFIESLVCGVPVIGGNADGSADALLQGELGTLVNPDSVEDITAAINKHIVERERDDEVKIKNKQEKTIEHYAFDKYKQRLKAVLVEG